MNNLHVDLDNIVKQDKTKFNNDAFLQKAIKQALSAVEAFRWQRWHVLKSAMAANQAQQLEDTIHELAKSEGVKCSKKVMRDSIKKAGVHPGLSRVRVFETLKLLVQDGDVVVKEIHDIFMDGDAPIEKGYKLIQANGAGGAPDVLHREIV